MTKFGSKIGHDRREMSPVSATERGDKDSGFHSAVVHLKELHPGPSIVRDGVDISAERSVVLYHFGPSICSQKVRLTLEANGVQ